MRTLVLIGLAGLATASGILDAEARGLRLHFGGLRAGKPVPAASIQSIPRQVTLTPGLAVRPDLNVGARPTYVVLPSPQLRPEPVEARSAAEAVATTGKPAAEAPAPAAAKAAAEAAPWCQSRRIVGTGAGFCLIN